MSVRSMFEQKLAEVREQKKLTRQIEWSFEQVAEKIEEAQENLDFLGTKQSPYARSVSEDIKKELSQLKKQKTKLKKALNANRLKLNRLTSEYDELEKHKVSLYIKEQCSLMVEKFLNELKKNALALTKLFTKIDFVKEYGLHFKLKTIMQEIEIPSYDTIRVPNGCFMLTCLDFELNISSSDFFLDEMLKVRKSARNPGYDDSWFYSFRAEFFNTFVDLLTQSLENDDTFCFNYIVSGYGFLLHLK